MKTLNNSSDALSVRRIFGTLIPLALLALLLSALILSIVNDMYAFVKKESDVPIDVLAPLSLTEFSELLQDRGIISNPAVFRIYVISKDKRDLIEGFSGRAELGSGLSYRQILQVIAEQNQ